MKAEDASGIRKPRLETADLIFNDDALVGFLMIGYNEAGIEPDAPEALKGNDSLWRLMIDRNHPGKGCGREAVCRAVEFIRTRPRGRSEYCLLSCEPDSEAAKKLYASFGSVESGGMDGDEIVPVLKL